MSVLNTSLNMQAQIVPANTAEALDVYEDFTPVVGGRHYVAWDGSTYSSTNPVQLTVKARAGRLDYARKQQTKSKRSISISVPVSDAFGNPTYSTFRLELDSVVDNEGTLMRLRNIAAELIVADAMSPFWTSGVAA